MNNQQVLNFHFLQDRVRRGFSPFTVVTTGSAFDPIHDRVKLSTSGWLWKARHRCGHRAPMVTG